MQAKIGSEVTYEAHFFSTLPDTFENSVRLGLGLGFPRSAVIPDRAFNERAAINATMGYEAVQAVQYDKR